ncbi:unnamed protein product [Cunninghamella echinulata]
MLLFFFGIRFYCTLLEKTYYTVICSASVELGVKCELKGGKPSCDCRNGTKLDISDNLIWNKLGL